MHNLSSPLREENIIERSSSSSCARTQSSPAHRSALHLYPISCRPAVFSSCASGELSSNCTSAFLQLSFSCLPAVFQLFSSCLPAVLSLRPWRFVCVCQLPMEFRHSFLLKKKLISRVLSKAVLQLDPANKENACSGQYFSQPLKGQSHEIFCTRFFSLTLSLTGGWRILVSLKMF